MRKINYLSVCDGMSCLNIALQKLGIIPNIYYASEIDKHAIKASTLMFPNIIHLGNMINIDVSKLEPIHFFSGGTPCTNFSFAGKRKGMATKDNIEIYTLEHYLQLKNDGFEFEGESFLFWEFIRILTDIRKYNPDVLFLLENVEMGKKWERVISEALGIFGVHINSALVSAQSRKRIYWTNIKVGKRGLYDELFSDIPQPKDREIFLKDILEREVDEKYFLSGKTLERLMKEKPLINPNKSYAVNTHNSAQSGSHRRTMTMIKLDVNGNLKKNQNKASCFTAGGHSGGLHSDMDLIVAMRGRNPENPTSRKPGLETKQQLEPRFDGKTNTITSVQKDNLVMTKNYIQWDTSGKGYKSQQDRAFYESSKHGSLTAQRAENKTGVMLSNSNIRRLTPRECFRLQTIPEHHINTLLNSGVSDTQLYKMAGNGWTVSVITHVLSFIQ